VRFFFLNTAVVVVVVVVVVAVVGVVVVVAVAVAVVGEVEEEKSFGGKIGVLVPEAFLRPTKQQGETKVFTSSENKITRTGHYFPKMPCLTCGSPWWIGDGGWNSTCANCGDDDRCYGLDQMPLRQFRGKHRKFCELVLKMNVDS